MRPLTVLDFSKIHVAYNYIQYAIDMYWYQYYNIVDIILQFACCRYAWLQIPLIRRIIYI
jgi:hypothetical protein